MLAKSIPLPFMASMRNSQTALQANPGFSGADTSGDERIEPQRSRVRSHPESLASHRRSGWQADISPEHVSEAIQ